MSYLNEPNTLPDGPLRGTAEKALTLLESPVIPPHENIVELLNDFGRVVDQFKEKEHCLTSPESATFSRAGLTLWCFIMKLIRRRVFKDDFGGNLIISVLEIDHIYVYGPLGSVIATKLPLIDFDMIACLGDLLLEILSNLSGNINTRMEEAQAEKDNLLRAALLKKDILDTLRTRAFRHRNCCTLFFDSICLQDAYKLTSSDSLVILLDILRRKCLVPVRVEHSDIYVFASPTLLHDEKRLEQFCISTVSNRGLHTDIIVVLNAIAGVKDVLASAFEEITVVAASFVLGTFASHSPVNCVTVTGKSVVELRQILHDINRTKLFEKCHDFKGFGFQQRAITFADYREVVYKKVSDLCKKIIQLNTMVAYEDVKILESHGLRSELDRSIFLASNFVFEYLLEVPSHYSFAYETFEAYVGPCCQWLPNCLRHMTSGSADASCYWFYLSRSLEHLNPLMISGDFKRPPFLKEGIQIFKQDLEEFSQLSFEGEFKCKQAYITDLGRAYIANIEGIEPKIVHRPPSIRFPDQKLLESNGYRVFEVFGSNKTLLYKCLDERSRRLVVVKRLEKLGLIGSRITNGEVGALISLHHLNIVRYLACFDNEKYWFMVMEHCQDRIAGYSKDGDFIVDELEARKTIRQVISGLVYLHSNHIVHRDIKPGNILKDGHGFIKIADFGDAQLIPIPLIDDSLRFDLNSIRGTPAYMAPECLVKAKVLPSADVWSLGCVLLYLVTGHSPWSHCTSIFNIYYVLSTTDELPADIDSLTCSDDCKRILRKIFKRNQEERPTLAELMLDPYFAEAPDNTVI